MLEADTTCWRLETAQRAALLVDMEPYLAATKAAMSKATRTIHFLNWAFDPDTVLDHAPDGSGSTPQTIGSFLRELTGSQPGLEIRILCWQSALPVAATQRFFPLRSRKFFAGTPIDFRLDGSLPLGASHHQKAVIVDDAVAFCGSCDIGPDRWDTPEHLNPDPRRAKTAKGSTCYDCRHEVMAMVDGAPAATLGALFRERWLRATGVSLPEPSTQEADVWPDHVQPDFTGVTVGLSRTQAPWKAFPERREGEAATLAAIASARTSLYLENQYFTSPLVAEALAQRLEETDGPEVVLVSTQHSPSWFDQMTMDKTRSVFLRRLEDADRHGRLRAYSPVTRDGMTIIVHAKLAIVDDRFIRLGSSNMNNRSEGFDSECDLTLDALEANDGEGQTCVAVFRSRLVSHWLGCTEEQIAQAEGQTLGERIETLRAAGFERLRPLRSQPLGAAAKFIATYHLGDPISAADSLRPWKRRAQMRHKLAATVHRLERGRIAAPEVRLEEGSL
ncbi:phospholipase D-like domain-containing protein [Brevundimonas variabilis]|uniref:Phospholipase D n=1 Tax=Brevundimonas variabilis TaxID=74312 RepID=A0A7W9CGW3_9CAUL|nr:phospholipase D-like domain-containing protein [Brevundimonas variabilis]MBB5745188.1 phosphatidylserine/phosphatidylglycerophosphate/cardiolipin synthase-like enzyme [Brevundimonas variabilis]